MRFNPTFMKWFSAFWIVWGIIFFVLNMIQGDVVGMIIQAISAIVQTACLIYWTKAEKKKKAQAEEIAAMVTKVADRVIRKVY